MKIRSVKKRKQTRWASGKPRRDVGWYARIKHLGRHLKPGTIIETCGLAVARVISVEGDDLDYEYIFGRYTSGRGCCSVYNCAPLRLSAAAIQRRREIFEKDGYKGLEMRYYREDCRMTDEEIALIPEY